MEHEDGDGDTSHNWSSRDSPQNLEKKKIELEIWGRIAIT